MRRKLIRRFSAALLALSLLMACGQPVLEGPSQADAQPTGSMELVYAQQFSVDYYPDGSALITIAGSDRFLLLPEGAEPRLELDGDITLLRQPLDDLYLAASSAMDFFRALDRLDRVRLRRPWQDWRLVSAHGFSCDAVAEVMGGKPVFFLTGGALDPAALCAQLAEAGLDALPVTVGENLFCPDEAIIQGSAGELAGRTFAPLNVMLAEAAPPMPRRAPGWPDEWFIRGKAPMTKRLVRGTVLSRLAATPHDLCWDVGAGTGSVSVELAAGARRVYAVECRPEACALIRENRARHNAWNLTLVEGRAPDALGNLPAPDAVFIGGSQGEMPAIINAVLTKNPSARLCVTAIALETLHDAMGAIAAHGIEAEVTQLSVSWGKAAGGPHLLTANNPTFLITGNCL